MDYDDWERYRNEKLAEYPCQDGKWRFDIELSHPRNSLYEVPIERNPHGFDEDGWFGFIEPHWSILGGHRCFYSNNMDWSTIFAVWSEDGETCRFLAESGNSEPLWGERVSLMSTSQYIVDEPWGTNPANKFAFFRGKYWRITWHQFLHDYNDLYRVMGNQIVPPIRNRAVVVSDRNTLLSVFGRPVFNYPNLADALMSVQPLRRILPFSYFRPQSEKINWEEEGF